MHELPTRLLQTIRKQEQIKAGDRLGIAVSGGADSVALLLLLLKLRAELGVVLSVAHVNHQLRGQESEEDEEFVAELAHKHRLELHAAKLPLAKPDSGIEAAARQLRYDFFRRLMQAGRVAKVATAHTLDDQAETVLLRMLRGTGIRGLAGIYPRIVFDGQGEVVRPLLDFRRADLEAFLRDQGQSWREDCTNSDPAFLRNRVRHQVLPLLKEQFGPTTVENLAGLAEIARAEEEHWESGHPEIRICQGDPLELETLATSSIQSLPVAAQRRLIRNWLEANITTPAFSFRTIEEVRELVLGPPGRKIELPGGHWVRRTQRELHLEQSGKSAKACDYEYRLPVPGAVDVPELRARVEAVITDPDAVPSHDRPSLLDPSSLPKELLLRNWRSGDRYWPAHTKEERKVKELLSDRHLTGATKKLWPVAVASELGLVWMRDFPVPAALGPISGKKFVLWIRIIARKQLETRSS